MLITTVIIIIKKKIYPLRGERERLGEREKRRRRGGGEFLRYLRGEALFFLSKNQIN